MNLVCAYCFNKSIISMKKKNTCTIFFTKTLEKTIFCRTKNNFINESGRYLRKEPDFKPTADAAVAFISGGKGSDGMIELHEF
jgi:hypothetical protein